MRDPKELTNLPPNIYILAAIGAYLEAHSQGEVGAKHLEQETLDKIDDLSEDVSLLLEANRNFDPPRYG